MIETEEIFEKLDWNSRLRCLNFCEVEFGLCGYYGYNNLEEIKEALLYDFECTPEEIIDMLYFNEDFEKDTFFFTNGRYIYSVSDGMLEDEFNNTVLDNLCNGELREIIEDEIGDKINY